MKKIIQLMGISLAVLIISGCSKTSNISTFTGQDAIAKYKSKFVCDFPDKPEEWQTIYRKLGPNHVLFKLEGETLYDEVGTNAYVITFNEKWLAIDDPRYPSNIPNNKSILTHQYKVKVTPDQILSLSDSGDPEPSNP